MVIEELEEIHITQEIEDKYIILRHASKADSFVALIRAEDCLQLSKVIHESSLRNSEMAEEFFEFDKMFSVGIKR